LPTTRWVVLSRFGYGWMNMALLEEWNSVTDFEKKGLLEGME
jgi:hypothetical protein